MRKVAFGVIAAAALLASNLVIASPAQASADCVFIVPVLINWGPGGESPSGALGHPHFTGSHYIKRVTNGGGTGKVNLDWWADNNGGLNFDGVDTFYARTLCDITAILP